MDKQLLTESEQNIIRGKNIVGKASKEDIDRLFEYLDALEMLLDEADEEDTYGTEGWRHHLEIDHD